MGRYFIRDELKVTENKTPNEFFDFLIFYYEVITGSTDGIGREYMNRLASQGINIVLISRSSLKLTEIASHIGLLFIEKKNDVQ